MTAEPTRSLAAEFDPIVQAVSRARELTARGATSEAVASFAHAAEMAAATGDADRSLSAFGEAIAIADETERIKLTRERGVVAVSFEHPDAESLWRPFAEDAVARGDLEAQALAQFHLSWCAEQPNTDHLRAGAALDGGGWSAQCDAMLKVLEGSRDQGREAARLAVECARDSGDGYLEALALQAVALHELVGGAHGDAIELLRLTGRLFGARSAYRWMVVSGLNLVEALAEDLQTEAALTACRELATFLGERGLTKWQHATTILEARALEHLGRLADAREVASRCEAGAMSDWWGAALELRTASIEMSAGTLGDRFEAALTASASAADRLDLAEYREEIDLLSVRATALTESAHVAAAAADGLEAQTPEARTALAVWAVRIAAASGDVAAVMQASTLIPDDVSSVPPLLTLQIDEARAIATAAQGGSALALYAIADRWRAAGRLLDAACCRQALADVLVIRGDVDAAMRSLVRAHGELLDCGASGRAKALQQQAGSLVRTGADLTGFTENALVAGLTDATRARLLASIVVVEPPRGQYLFGDHAPEALYLLRKGGVRLYRVAGGRKLTVAVLGPGSVFGESCVVGVHEHGIVAEAGADCVLGMLPAGRVRAALQTEPRFAENLLRILHEQVTSSRSLAEEVAYWPVRRRFAALVLKLTRAFGAPTLDGGTVIDHAFTHEELAEMIGTTRATATRELRHLVESGVVAMRGRRLVVVGREQLEEIEREALAST